jgi:hypothetical protein
VPRTHLLIAILGILPAPTFAQALRLSPAAAAPGQTAQIQLSLESPRGNSPTALQWELTIPLQLTLAEDSPSAGAAAQAAAKTLNCAPRTKSQTAQTHVCILYGGQQGIENGVVAVLRLKVATDAKPGSAPVTLDQAIAVYKDLKKVSLERAESVVTIREK